MLGSFSTSTVQEKTSNSAVEGSSITECWIAGPYPSPRCSRAPVTRCIRTPISTPSECLHPGMTGIHPSNSVTQPPFRMSIEPRKDDLRVTPVLLPDLRGLEHQRHLRPGIAQPIRRNPGDVLEIFGMRKMTLVGPSTAGVRRERHIQHPRRSCITAHPHLTVGANLRESGIERPKPTLVDIPWRPTITKKQAKSFGVTGQDRNIHIVMGTRNTGERLDAPPTDNPPRTVEPLHERSDTGRIERSPLSIPTSELLRRKRTSSRRLRRRRR